MQENTIFIKRYKEESIVPIDEKEIWRYAGYRGNISDIDEELKGVFEEVKAELTGAFSYKVCYRRMNIEWDGCMPVLPFSSNSKKLARCLSGSNEIILFAATVGLEIDRYIARCQKTSPLKALIAQAFGAERIESLCDTFCNDIKAEIEIEKLFATSRFSPGYGDLPLETQTEIFKLLDCNRQIGVSLNNSLLMSPSKSVTAIMGLKCIGKEAISSHKCSECNKTDCEFRKQEN